MVGMPTANPVFGESASGRSTGITGSGFGPTLYVNTVTGSTRGNARSPKNANSTMEGAFDVLANMNAVKAKSADNAVIYWVGVIAEQITAPLGVSGVSIVAVQGGNNRHDNGARWKQAATAGNAPLLTLREQGWVVRGGVFVPQATYSGVRLRRQEDATYPDASHAIIQQVRFIGDEATPAGIGLEDYGGGSHYRVVGCEFSGLVTGYSVTNQGVDIPNHNFFASNVFFANTNHFSGAQYYSIVEGNRFITVTTGTNAVVNMITGQAASAAHNNFVLLNQFPDTAATIKVNNGYTGSTTDTWNNYATGTAALTVESPPGAS